MPGPDGDLLSTWQRLGGSGPAYPPDEDTAVQAVLEKNSFALTGWKVMAELPNPWACRPDGRQRRPGRHRYHPEMCARAENFPAGRPFPAGRFVVPLKPRSVP